MDFLSKLNAAISEQKTSGPTLSFSKKKKTATFKDQEIVVPKPVQEQLNDRREQQLLNQIEKKNQQITEELEKVSEKISEQQNTVAQQIGQLTTQQQSVNSREIVKKDIAKAFKQLSSAKNKQTVEERVEELTKLKLNTQNELLNVKEDIKRYDKKLSETVNKETITKLKKLRKKSNKIQTDLETNLGLIEDELNKFTFERPDGVIEETTVDIETAAEVITQLGIDEEDIDEINVSKVVEETAEALEAIPDAGDFTLEDIKIIKSEKKDKTGYFKTKVQLKPDKLPGLVNQIASYVKQQSNGLIKPRLCDMRVIGNTNKTQLRNSKQKLTALTIVFKPDHKRLKVNKGTRFMVSVPEDFDSTNNLLLYLQESRSKTIIEVTPKDFHDINQYIEWVGDKIAQYYFQGYDVTLSRLNLRGADNPFVDIAQAAIKTNEYKVRFDTDKETNEILGLTFKQEYGSNQWLHVKIEPTETGEFRIFAYNTISNDEYTLSDKNFNHTYLVKNIISMLGKTYARDWSQELKDSDLNEYYYMSGKLTHSKLYKAFVEMVNTYIDVDNPQEVNTFGLEIVKTGSKQDMKRFFTDDVDYDSECIVGKTDSGYFTLMYYAHQFIGGDVRNGQDYITRQQYYQKYSVNNRGEYRSRAKVQQDLNKDSTRDFRNYNARKYMFLLKYQINGKEYTCLAKTFEQIKERTNFLSSNPIPYTE